MSPPKHVSILSANRIRLFFWASLKLLLLACSLGIPSAATAEDWIYTVRPGDNLWELSREYLKDTSYYSRLQAHNGINLPRQLAPGTKLRMPLGWLKQEPLSARVSHVLGRGDLIRASTNESMPLESGLLLAIGDAVQTGTDSSATLQFADGSSLVILSNSRVVMDTLSSYGKSGMVDTRLRLQRGRVESRSQPSKEAPSWFEIITPAAVTAIRGTEFRVGLDNDRPISRTEVLEGLVAVTGGNTTFEVPAGFGIVAEAGEPLQPPRALLPAPDITGFPPIVKILPINLSWPALAGADNYRLQISAGGSFDTLLRDEVLPLPGYKLSNIPDGQYLIRIRGVDESALEGENSEHSFIVRLPEIEPPELITPIRAASLRELQPLFSWAEAQNVEGYRIQISDDEGFESLTIDQEVSITASYRPSQALQPGKYFWRVASRGLNGTSSSFGEIAVVILEKPLYAPIVDQPRETQHLLLFRWHDPEFSPSRRFQFQLAYDRGFKRLIANRLLQKQLFVLRKPVPGNYFFRVRHFDPASGHGPFSETHSLNLPETQPPTWWQLFPGSPPRREH